VISGKDNPLLTPQEVIGMGMQASFTSEEWRTLQFAPLWVLISVGGLDPNRDNKEVVAFLKEEALLYKGELAGELLSSLVSDFNAIFKEFLAYAKSQPDYLRSLGEIADILESKATPDEARKFKGAMILVGTKIAEASGAGGQRALVALVFGLRA
jgi:hypothetical protein